MRKTIILTILCLSFLSLKASQFDTVLFFKAIDRNCYFPEIVKAQVILETNFFTSRLCKENNNYFGMMSFNSNKYAKYDSWEESIKAYCLWQIRRKKQMPDSFLSKERYFRLLDIKYCWEVNYSERLKILIKSKKYKNLVK
jgi:flagellum-specific peptidoglycan hydrolase FlgJ